MAALWTLLSRVALLAFGAAIRYETPTYSKFSQAEPTIGLLKSRDNMFQGKRPRRIVIIC